MLVERPRAARKIAVLVPQHRGEVRCGWIVSRTDSAALRSIVQDLLADPVLAARVGQAARRRVLERHTWAAVGGIVEQIAAEQLGRRAASGAPTMEAL